MALSDDSVRQIAKVLRKHVAPEPLDHIVNDLREIRGDKEFRDTVERRPSRELAPPDRGLSRRSSLTRFAEDRAH